LLSELPTEHENSASIAFPLLERCGLVGGHRVNYSMGHGGGVTFLIMRCNFQEVLGPSAKDQSVQIKPVPKSTSVLRPNKKPGN
jgi:hypothetical protein